MSQSSVMPEVSIVMPLYNKEKYVEETLRSVSCQSFTDYELIVIDDGSTDKSCEIVTRYLQKDNRIRLIRIPNGGVSGARNRGLAEAKGEWIQFLDADDRLEPLYLSEAVSAAEKANADILFTNFTMVDADGRSVKSIENDCREALNQAELCQNYVDWQLKNGFFGYISNKLFKRSLWEKSGARFPATINLAEDLDFFVQMYPFVQKAFFLPVNSFLYLQTESNYTQRQTVDYFSQLLIQLDVKKWFIAAGQYEGHREFIDGRVADYVYFTLFDADERQEDIKKVCERLLGTAGVADSLCTDRRPGFSGRVLRALNKENIPAVCRLFAWRARIRNMYRSIRRNG